MSSVQINGLLLRTLRKGKGLDQTQLAAQAGIDPSVVSRMESGFQSNFKLSVVAAVADVLGTGVDALLLPPRHRAAPEALDAELAAVMPLLARLPVDHQRRIAALLRAYVATAPE